DRATSGQGRREVGTFGPTQHPGDGPDVTERRDHRPAGLPPATDDGDLGARPTHSQSTSALRLPPLSRSYPGPRSKKGSSARASRSRRRSATVASASCERSSVPTDPVSTTP